MINFGTIAIAVILTFLVASLVFYLKKRTLRNWALPLLIVCFGYGIFLIVQVFVDVWPSEKIHNIAMFVGGVALIIWGGLGLTQLRIRRV